jgi:K+-sensing histidine kinase KdpD
MGWAAGVALVAAASSVDGLLRAHLVLPSLAVLYLVAVLSEAVVWGFWPAVTVALLSMFVFDYLFVAPPFAFTPADPRSWPALPVFVIAAVVGNELAARARRRARELALDRERLLREALKAEVLERSDKAKTAILRAVSHDLRTPLMAILTAAGALAAPEFVTDDADRADLLATVLGESRRLDRLVANLLDLSRLEAEAAVPRVESVAVSDLMADAVGAVGDDAARVRVRPCVRVTVRADADQVQRILVNLIATATAAEVLIRVIDHGPGVPPEEATVIFGAFHRGAGNRQVRGAGLGLAIAAGFAEVNGGRIWVESRERPGSGATFVLALPAQEPT